MATYKRTITVDELLSRVIRILGGYVDGDTISLRQMENARFVLNGYLDSLDNASSTFFLRSNRQRVFSPTSIVLEGGTYYRTILGFTAPNITTWASGTAYAKGATVYPAAYNGYCYEAQGLGTSGGSEPTFPTRQNNTVTDNDISWKTLPDTKPNPISGSSGANWRSFFISDSTQSTGASYAVNTAYHRSGDFDLQDDEVNIESAFIRKDDTDTTLTIVSNNTFNTVSSKANEGQPTHLYLENIGLNTKAHLYPSPDIVGEAGYILHYSARLRAENYSGSTTLAMPDEWIEAAVYNVADRLSDEYQLTSEDKSFIAARAKQYTNGARHLDIPAVSQSENVIVSVY